MAWTTVQLEGNRLMRPRSRLRGLYTWSPVSGSRMVTVTWASTSISWLLRSFTIRNMKAVPSRYGAMTAWRLNRIRAWGREKRP